MSVLPAVHVGGAVVTLTVLSVLCPAYLVWVSRLTYYLNASVLACPACPPVWISGREQKAMTTLLTEWQLAKPNRGVVTLAGDVHIGGFTNSWVRGGCGFLILRFPWVWAASCVPTHVCVI